MISRLLLANSVRRLASCPISEGKVVSALTLICSTSRLVSCPISGGRMVSGSGPRSSERSSLVSFLLLSFIFSRARCSAAPDPSP